jgi:hypothetical protein
VDGNRLIQKQTDEQENFIEYVREFKADMMYLVRFTGCQLRGCTTFSMHLTATLDQNIAPSID